MKVIRKNNGVHSAESDHPGSYPEPMLWNEPCFRRDWFRSASKLMRGVVAVPGGAILLAQEKSNKSAGKTGEKEEEE
jgi:hypothetical protein